MLVLFERELIGEGWNIYGDIGIGVLVLGFVDIVVGFDYEVVVEFCLVEFDCGVDFGEFGVDD